MGRRPVISEQAAFDFRCGLMAARKSQRELALQTNLALERVWRILNRVHGPTPAEWRAMCEAIDQPNLVLFVAEEEPEGNGAESPRRGEAAGP
jgi:hypothetical protein